MNPDKERSDQLMFIENWASEEILDQHARSAHLKALVDGLAPLTTRPRREVQPAITASTGCGKIGNRSQTTRAGERSCRWRGL